MKKSICKLLLSIMFSAPIFSYANGFHSGQYEALQLAVSPDNKITGFYQETRDVSTCQVYFSGIVNKNATINVNAWSFNIHSSGTLEKTSDGVSLAIVNGQRYPGCGNAMGPMIETGMTLSTVELKKWLELVMINDDKVFLYASPSESSVHHAYVVKDDVVAINKYSAEWSFVTYTNPDNFKQSSGWIKNSQYKKLEPPSTPEAQSEAK